MEDIPAIGAMIVFNLEDGVLCLAVVTEVSHTASKLESLSH